jgi:hypothetical protein
LGWTLSAFLAPNIGPVIAGFAIGILQWVILQNYISNAWRWSIATGVGWAIGLAIILFTIPQELGLLYGAILGLTVGIAQWFILRQDVQRSGWWIAISVIGWTAGLTLLPGPLTTGVLAGALTGVALELLLRYPKSGVIEKGKSE